MRHIHRAATRGARARLLTLSLAGAALLGFAPAALADTTVKIKSGTFGNGLSGTYLFVTDTTSIFDEPMQVLVERAGTRIRVTDAVGQMHAQAPCVISGASAFCPAADLDGMRLEGSDKNDVITSNVDLPTAWFGDHGDDVLQGGPVVDQMNGEAGDDILRGDDGRDTFVQEPGNDRLDGQSDTDTVSYSGAITPVSVTLDDGLLNDGQSSEPDRVLNVENAIGSRFGDFIAGSDDRNVLSGRAGNDTMRGLGANDLIDGDEGSDDIGGGTGVDTVTYAERTAGVDVTLNNITGDGGIEDGATENIRSDVENLEGGSGPDSLTGPIVALVANTLDGNDGADILDGGAGDDVANGGLGNDRLIGDVGTDDYEGAGGFDLLDYSDRSGDFTEDLTVTLANSFLLAGNDGGASDGPVGDRDDARNIESVITGDGNDRVAGDAGDDRIATGKGDDVVVGNDGADTLTPGAGRDAVNGGNGDDTLFTRDGEKDEPIVCGAGVDTIEADIPLDFTDSAGGLQIVNDCEVILP